MLYINERVRFPFHLAFRIYPIAFSVINRPTDMTKLTSIKTPLVVLGALASILVAPLSFAENGDITLPEGFTATVYAEGLDGIRGIAVSPSGDVYGRVRGRGITAMRDTNGDGAADEITTVPSSTGEGSGIGIRNGYLYYSTNDEILRYTLPSGKLLPTGAPESMITGLGNRNQHNSKMFSFDGKGNLYVEVGSPSNSLGDPDRAPNAKGLSEEDVQEFLSEWGGIWRFDENKKGQSKATGFHFSTGHRHIIGHAWNDKAGALFAVQNGRDVINIVNPLFSTEYNATRVSEEFHILKEGSNLGWPYTYYDPIDKKRLFSPEYGGDGEKEPEAGRFQDPIIAFPAHWAPMQMAYYGADAFPEHYRNGVFIVFHGSWNRQPEQAGGRVAFIETDDHGMPTGEWDTFANDFMGKEKIVSPGEANYRPMGVAVGPDGALYIGSDQGGRVWRVTYGE